MHIYIYIYIYIFIYIYTYLYIYIYIFIHTPCIRICVHYNYNSIYFTDMILMGKSSPRHKLFHIAGPHADGASPCCGELAIFLFAVKIKGKPTHPVYAVNSHEENMTCFRNTWGRQGVKLAVTPHCISWSNRCGFSSSLNHK